MWADSLVRHFNLIQSDYSRICRPRISVCAGEGFPAFLSRRPCQRASAEQVNVHVKHRLTCAGTDIQDSAVSLLDLALARDFGSGEMAAANDLGVGGLGFLQSSKMPFGNDEHMRGCLRVDVFEGEDVFVFVDFLGRNLAADDATEKAVWIGHGSVPGRNDNTGAANLSAGWKERSSGTLSQGRRTAWNRRSTCLRRDCPNP